VLSTDLPPTIVPPLSTATEHPVSATEAAESAVPVGGWPTPEVKSTRELPSPDGRWVAREVHGAGQEIDYGPAGGAHYREYRGLLVTDSQSERTLRPVERWEEGDIGVCDVQVIGWRADSGQLYYRQPCSGDGCVGYGPEAVLGLDVSTGATESVESTGWGHVVDPAGTRMAFATMPVTTTGQLNVLDLITREVRAIASFPAATVGGPVWSAAGDSVAVVVGTEPDEDCRHITRRRHVMKADLASGETTELFESRWNPLWLQAWRADGLLEAEIPADGGKRTILIDPATGQEQPGGS
jgi:hypothetical protein